MSTSFCGRCRAGEYLCPSDQTTCVATAADYPTCPNLKGTHLDWTLDVESRLDYLVAHTDLPTQVSQLSNTAAEIAHLGIPSYQWLNDDQHGVARTPARATVFPNGVALGATWSVDTLHEVGRIIGTEARGLHNGFLASDPTRSMKCNGCSLTMYAPNLNLVRDPRWGRAQEVFGEDPSHMGVLVVAMITGMQNNTEGSDVGPAGRLLAGSCCKHFAAYDVEGGAGTADRSYFDAQVNGRDLWESHMPAFKRCIKDAKATHMMCSYNRLNGVPACGNGGLLNDVLRKQWGFQGFVVSDYDAWALLFERNYTASMEEAAAVGLNAGLDQEGGGSRAIAELPAAIKDGKTGSAAVATALRRLFRVRINLGMLDAPTSTGYYSLRYNATELATNSEHRAVARRAADESMTLLKNDHGTLPLRPSKVRRLAVIGPQANFSGILMGNYAEKAAQGNWGLSIVEALKARLEPGGAAVHFENGLPWIGSNASSDGFAAATKLAASADAVVVVLGLAFNAFCLPASDGRPPSSSTGTGTTVGTDPFRGTSYCEKEAQDRSQIELPTGQAKMVAALRGALPKGTPLIGVMVHGGAIALGDTLGRLDALLDAWYPGLEGGPAIAAALVGDRSPAGRAAVTFYTSSDELPQIGTMAWYPNASLGSKGYSYRYYLGTPLFPFGFGLSYTTFGYSELAAASSSVGPCDEVKLSVKVSNTGAVDSDEVVQVYTRQPHASVPVPHTRLAAFTRIHLKAGASRVVRLTLTPETRAVVRHGEVTGRDVYGASASQYVEGGDLLIFVGGGQPDFFEGRLSATVKVVGEAALSRCDK